MSADTGTSDIPSPPVNALTAGKSGTLLKEYGNTRKDLEMETFDLIAKVKELLTTHDLWGPDGTYTFEDGERWAKLEIEDESILD